MFLKKDYQNDKESNKWINIIYGQGKKKNSRIFCNLCDIMDNEFFLPCNFKCLLRGQDEPSHTKNTFIFFFNNAFLVAKFNPRDITFQLNDMI
jgi:hypothetical protein